MKDYSIIFVIGGKLTNVFTKAASPSEAFKALYKAHGPIFNEGMSEDRFILWCNLWWKEGNKDQSITVTEVLF